MCTTSMPSESQPTVAEKLGDRAVEDLILTTAEDDPDQSEVLRRPLRLGLREAASEYVEALRAAVRDYATRDL